MKTTKRVCSAIQKANIYHLNKMSPLALNVMRSESKVHCIPNVVTMTMTVNLTIEVIFRNCFGDSSYKCLILKRDYIWHGKREGNPKRVSVEVWHSALLSAPRFPGIVSLKTVYAS